MSQSKKLTDYNFAHGLHLGQNGFYRPILPEDVNRPLTHDEMDYNIQLIGGIISGYRVIGTGTDGALDVTNDANKRLKLYKVTSSDTEIIASGSEINNLVWIVDNPGEVTSDLVPDQNEVYDLGSPTKKFRDLYLSNNTIYLGDDSVSTSEGKIKVNNIPLIDESDFLAEIDERARLLGIETELRTVAVSSLNNKLTAINDETSAVAQSVLDLNTGFTADLTNAITGEQLARTEAISGINETLTSLSTGDGAIAESITALDTKFTTEINDAVTGQNTLRTDAVANIEQKLATLTTADEARALAVTNLSTKFTTDIDAAIAGESNIRTEAITDVTSQISAVSDTNSANITRVDTLEAQYTIEDGSITGFSEASALKTTIDSAIATANQVTINSTTSAIVKLDNQVAGVTTQQSADIDALTGKVNAQYTLEVNADGNVAGMKLGADETGSTIAFTADSFKVSSEDANGTLLTPFSIVDGQVAFNGAVSFSEGPQGPAGPAGADGADGADGLTGLDGTDGLPGAKGADGVSTYFHVAYADTASGGGFSQSPAGKLYIGTYVDSTSADAPSGSSLWKWQLIKGADGENGENGIPGINGDDGKTTYLHIAYATNITGTTGFSTTVSTGKTYIGQYTDFTLADSTNPALYKWALIKGDKGDPGVPGAKGADGSAGVNARAVSLTAGTQIFEYNAQGVLDSPTSTTITVTQFNSTSYPYYKFYVNDVEVSSGQLPAYKYTPNSDFAEMPQTIEVELREGNNNESTPVLARDQITMAGIKPGADGANGADGMTVILSNEAHTLPTTSAGVVEYLGSGSSIRVYEGVNEVLYDGVGTGASRWKVTASPTNITVGTITDSGNFATVGNHSAMTQNTASITYTITGKRFNGTSFSFTKTQTFAKSIQGATGPQGPAPDVSQFLTTTTTIDGGKITTGIIKNGNFVVANPEWSTYSTTGMGINLDKGAINAKNFYIDGDGNAKFRGDVDIAGGAKIGGELAAGIFEVAPVDGIKRLKFKSDVYFGQTRFDLFTDDFAILSNNVAEFKDAAPEPMQPVTLAHNYVKRKDVSINVGDLVKLDENNELVKTNSTKDPAIVGILWEEIDFTIKESPLDKFLINGKDLSERDHHYRDSLGNKIPLSDRDQKSIWRVASIGDSIDTGLAGMKVCNQNGLVLKGDLLCSSDTPGYVMKQPTEWAIIGFDNGTPQYEERQIITSYTVGKCMEDCTFDNEGKTEGVYGYLYCG